MSHLTPSQSRRPPHTFNHSQEPPTNSHKFHNKIRTTSTNHRPATKASQQTTTRATRRRHNSRPQDKKVHSKATSKIHPHYKYVFNERVDIEFISLECRNVEQPLKYLVREFLLEYVIDLIGSNKRYCDWARMSDHIEKLFNGHNSNRKTFSLEL